MAIKEIPVPDIGGAEDVEVIEVSVAAGDSVEQEQTLVVLESDKASMEIPAPMAGKVVEVKLKVGDKVAEGSLILTLETEGAAAAESAPAPQATTAEQPKATEAPASQPAPAAAAGGTSVETIAVPDIGTSDEVDVIEVLVAEGDKVNEGDSLIVLESDKASMEVPAPMSGTVKRVLITAGGKAAQGTPIVELEVAGAASSTAAAPSAPTAAPAPQETAAQPAAAAQASAPSVQTVAVPDIGTSDEVDVIEVVVSEGDEIAEGDSLVVLESDKASMEVPAPFGGKVKRVLITAGGKASQGTPIVELEVAGRAAAAPAPQASAPQPQQAASQPASAAPAQPATAEAPQPTLTPANGEVYAGPAVRRLARELGIDLHRVPGSGPKGRIQKDDLKRFVKSLMSNTAQPAAGAPAVGGGIPAVPEVDFAQFGEVRVEAVSKLNRVTAFNMQRSWLNVPHVTQFDDADITDLEAFRGDLKDEAAKRGVKATPLPFLLKACAVALKAHPKINSSLQKGGEELVYKQYVHIGMAVDTPAGLVVPVIRDVDRKSIWELAAETAELAQKAKERKLKPADMQGGSFTISSLGGIGGQGFTPIVNTPEVAILGVSKMAVKPVWNGSSFEPRKMLPLCLSYDHRVVNGADAGRFLTDLVGLLGDLRRLLL